MQVTINEKEGFVTIENNGHGLPVEASAEFRFFRPRHMKTPQVTASPSQPFLQ
jgi:DNA gyrase/topoisomerase IV subunit B